MTPVTEPRPAPHMISFAPECFEQVPQTLYVVHLPAPGYPARFTSPEAAKEFARVRGRTVQVHTTSISRRIRWN